MFTNIKVGDEVILLDIIAGRNVAVYPCVEKVQKVTKTMVFVGEHPTIRFNKTNGKQVCSYDIWGYREKPDFQLLPIDSKTPRGETIKDLIAEREKRQKLISNIKYNFGEQWENVDTEKLEKIQDFIKQALNRR